MKGWKVTKSLCAGKWLFMNEVLLSLSLYGGTAELGYSVCESDVIRGTWHLAGLLPSAEVGLGILDNIKLVYSASDC